MRNIGISFLLIGILLSCSDNENPTSNSVQTKAPVQKTPEIENLIDPSIVSAFPLVDVQDLNPAIVVELKYATTDNFMGMVLYERLKSAYLQKDVAERLSKVQIYLSKLKPGYRLCIYDALRPVSVQQKMWDALDSLPPVERGKFVSNPKNRSLHNLGAAVDLTILDQDGKALDMGANYDDIRQIA
ncbi:MAG: M15 family metallopeptidase, partial [Flavobacteriales bacterium]